jgi:hypothetical protein
MIMSAALSIAQTPTPHRAIGRRALAALCEVWTAYTLKRAIADVASTCDEDYRDFGLDKGEILAALTSLRDEIKARGTLVASPVAHWRSRWRSTTQRFLLALEQQA